MNYIFGLILIGLVVQSRSRELPEGFITCPRQSNNRQRCLTDAIIVAIGLMAHGLSDFKIPPLEPLSIDNLSIENGNAAGGIDQVYKNVKIHGLTKDLTIHQEPFHVDDLVLRSKTLNNEIKLVANYSVQGRVLMMPIHGNGTVTITMSRVTTEHEMQFETYHKNGEEFLSVKKYTIKLSPENVHFEFTNLFDGNHFLSDTMHIILNENWQALFGDTKEPFEKTFGDIFKKMANNIFASVPLKKIFPDE